MGGEVVGLVSALSVLVAAPAIVFYFIYKVKKDKNEVKKLQYQKEILELEIKKQDSQLKLLEAENKKYDKIISGHIETGG